LIVDQLERVFSTRGWLSRQPQPFRTMFIGLGRLIALERGAPVFHTGDGSGGVYGIVSGAIEVRGGTSRQLPVLAHIERAGDWFGHGPVLRGSSRSLTFVAAEPSTLLQVPLERLRPQLQSDPDFAARLAQMADASTETVIGVARDLLIRSTPLSIRIRLVGSNSPDQDCCVTRNTIH
jgi:CRP-like cAMP-binding protein